MITKYPESEWERGLMWPKDPEDNSADMIDIIAKKMAEQQKKAATAKPVSATPVIVPMRSTRRISEKQFDSKHIAQDTIYAMMKNKVEAVSGGTIPTKMIQWCENNCSDFWMTDPNTPTYIRFASEDDMTLFLTAFRGG